MKLKTVIAKFEYVIVVEDEDTFPAVVAREHLIEALRDMGDGGADITVHDYTEGSCKDWYSNAIPYGGDGNTTTGEHLARHNAGNKRCEASD
jgi:hypothetical protein